MKYGFKILPVLLLLSSTLFAGGSHIQLLGGIPQGENSDSTFVFGAGIDFIKTFENGIELGGGAEALYFNNQDFNASVDTDISFLFGYNFQNNSNIPIAIRMGLGIIKESSTKSGLVYQIGTEYEFSKNFGAGIKYKIQELELPVDTSKANTQSALMYLYFRN